MNFQLQIFVYLVIPLASFLVAEVCYRKISFELLFVITDRICLESSTIVVFIKYPDPARDQVEVIHFF